MRSQKGKEDKTTTKYVLLWILSMVLFAVALMVFAGFIFRWRQRLKLIIIFSCIVISAVFLYVLSTRRLMTDNGYTLVQAIIFSRIASNKKLKKLNPKDKEKHIMKKAGAYEFSKDLTVSQVKEMIRIGQSTESTVKKQVKKILK